MRILITGNLNRAKARITEEDSKATIRTFFTHGWWTGGRQEIRFWKGYYPSTLCHYGDICDIKLDLVGYYKDYSMHTNYANCKLVSAILILLLSYCLNEQSFVCRPFETLTWKNKKKLIRKGAGIWAKYVTAWPK